MCSQWLRKVFADKELLLQSWYSLPYTAAHTPSMIPVTWPPLIQSSHTNYAIKQSAVVVMIAVAILTMCMVLVPLVKWMLLLFVIFAICVTSMGGMDKIELAWFTSSTKSNSNKGIDNNTSPNNNINSSSSSSNGNAGGDKKSD